MRRRRSLTLKRCHGGNANLCSRRPRKKTPQPLSVARAALSVIKIKCHDLHRAPRPGAHGTAFERTSPATARWRSRAVRLGARLSPTTKWLSGSRRSYVKRANCPVAARRYAVQRRRWTPPRRRRPVRPRPSSSAASRTAFAVQSRESIDEKVAACFYANDISFATRRDGARRRAGARALAVVGRGGPTRPHARAVVGVGCSV